MTPEEPRVQRGGTFRTTRWSIVTGAAEDGERRAAALEELCATYWYPLYALARRRGLPAAGAEDAVQGFFADLLARGDVARADPSRGRFRSFLCTAFRNWSNNERDRANTAKRGGGAVPMSLDDAETRYEAASGRALEPDALFDRAWALTMLDVALASLRESYAVRGQEARFDALRGFLTGDEPDAARAQLAASLGMTEGALAVAIHRLRERYRDALTAAVGDTVERDDEVERELGALFAALSG